MGSGLNECQMNFCGGKLTDCIPGSQIYVLTEKATWSRVAAKFSQSVAGFIGAAHECKNGNVKEAEEQAGY